MYIPRKILYRGILEFLSAHMYLLLLVPLFIVAYPLLKPGIIISHDFPIFDIDKLWTWIDKGSYSSIETIPRLPITGLWYLAGFIGIGPSIISKLMVVLGFFLASFSSYFAFHSLLKNKIRSGELRLKIAALIVGVFYSYNVWSFIRINHWYLWIGYAILPLFFLFIIYSFRNPRNFKFILISSVLWSFASTTPHMVIYYGLIFTATFIVFLLHQSVAKQSTRKLIIPLLLTLVMYSLFNAYWIYPFLKASSISEIGPHYSLNYEIGQILSRESNFLNTLRLSTEWTNLLKIDPNPNSILYPPWIFSSFAIPVLAFCAMLFTKELKYTLVYFMAVIIGVVLAMGTQSPISYYTLIFLTPLGWLFRDPDKWSYLIAFGYAFLSGITILKMLNSNLRVSKNAKVALYASFFVIIITAITIFNYPVYENTLTRKGTLNPIIVPPEFPKLDTFLGSLDADKIFYLPYPDYIGAPNENTSTYWSEGREVPSIYQINSAKPNIEIREPGIASPELSNYYNHLEKSIIQNRIKNINNFVYPLGTKYLIFHDDKSDIPKDAILLSSLHKLEGLFNSADIGFFKIFKLTNTTTSPREVNVVDHNIAVLQGLDSLTALNLVPSFDSLNSSVLFLDALGGEKKLNMLKISDNVIMGKSAIDFLLSFVDDMYVIKPYDATIHHEPSKLWSRAGTMDPLHGDFHPYLNDLGIQNWDFDYGDGVVITKAMGTKLDIPLDIKDTESYDLFIRDLKSQKGGQMKIYLDNNLISQIDTLDRISSKFVWEKVGSANLTKGKHRVAIENVGGFNAVNIFAFVPVNEMNKLKAETSGLLSDNHKKIIYLMEAESNFYDKTGADTGSFRNLLNNIDSLATGNSNGSSQSNFTKYFKGDLQIPSNADLIKFQILAKNHNNSNGYFEIKDLRITPSYKKHTVFSSDFEGIDIALRNLRALHWVNNDKDLVSTSIVSSEAIGGNNSLKVDLKESNKFGWSSISSENIPINENEFYNVRLDISAKDVKQLHSKILYLDSRKKALNDEGDYIFEGKDGAFHGTFSSSILPPKDAKYLKFRILEKTANPKPASYILDNVKVEEIPISLTALDNNIQNIKMVQNNGTFYKAQSKPLPVLENRPYKYILTGTVRNVDTISALALFRNSLDIVENSTGYGNNASNGRVLTISNGAGVYTDIDIQKSSNYTIALRANTCVTCDFLTVNLEKKDKNTGTNNDLRNIRFSLKSNNSGLRWIYSNSTYLTQGRYEFSIFASAKSDLDSVMIFETSNKELSNTYNAKKQSSYEDIFSHNVNPPAIISGYDKINPTKFTLSIKNATRPYMISFAESYDPYWIASYDNTNNAQYASGTGSNSIPLYGIVNGFYLNKTGNYSVTIEYQPQKWFSTGAMISLAVVAISISLFLFVSRTMIRRNFHNIKSKTLHLLDSKHRKETNFQSNK
jgi:hypothetical protein